MPRLKTIAAVLLAATLPALAQAADFNLTGGSGSTAKVTVASGGITLNVTGPSLGTSLDLTRSTGGLGVSTGLLDLPGIGDKEAVTLTFSQAVNLTNLKLAEWDLSDKATLSWAGGSVNLAGDALVATTGNEPLSNVVGSVFTLTGTGALTTFRLNAVTATAVPEASTYALMGLGLAGIAAVRRRQKSA